MDLVDGAGQHVLDGLGLGACEAGARVGRHIPKFVNYEENNSG